ncbi:MAG: hypothetical protein JSS72_00395 [Armatimonadetes bacterium]|nr:hypothetical protein [Armatimonadota bacterium]
MISILVYVVAAGFCSVLVTSIALGMRSPGRLVEARSSWIVFFCVLSTFSAPYMYIEALTNLKGREMADACKKAYASSDFNGQMKYYKLLSIHDDHAHALVVGVDDRGSEWGGVENPVLSVDLVRREDGSWKAETYKVLASGRLNQNNLVLPPYF